jgi:hypothetical protein
MRKRTVIADLPDVQSLWSADGKRELMRINPDGRVYVVVADRQLWEVDAQALSKALRVHDRS